MAVPGKRPTSSRSPSTDSTRRRPGSENPETPPRAPTRAEPPQPASTESTPARALPTSDLDRARTAYAERRFHEAYGLFQTALERERGSPSGELLYALGNCALELGRPAEAVWHYRRALLRLPRSAELRKNLALALSDLGHEPHPTTLSARTDDLLDRLTRGERIATALAAQTALLALLLAVRRRRLLRLLVAATLLVVAGLAVREILRDFAPPHPRAVVLDARAALRTEPHPSSAPLVEILGGTSCQVIEASDRWAFVTTDDTEGWLERRLLGTID